MRACPAEAVSAPARERSPCERHRRGFGKLRFASLDLVMAVRTDEHALSDFSGQCLETPVMGAGDVKSLLCRLDVMKRQGMHRSAVPADPTGSTAYSDQIAFERVALLRRAAVRAATVASGSRMTLAAVIDEPTTADSTGCSGPVVGVAVSRGPRRPFVDACSSSMWQFEQTNMQLSSSVRRPCTRPSGA